MRTLTLSLLLSSSLTALACSNNSPPAESPNQGASEEPDAVSDNPITNVQPEMEPGQEVPPPADVETAERPEITREECEENGGQVIGDIGDGAIYQTAYMCPSGTPPTGNIKPAEEGPTPVEGAVCCN